MIQPMVDHNLSSPLWTERIHTNHKLFTASHYRAVFVLMNHVMTSTCDINDVRYVAKLLRYVIDGVITLHNVTYFCFIYIVDVIIWYICNVGLLLHESNVCCIVWYCHESNHSLPKYMPWFLRWFVICCGDYATLSHANFSFYNCFSNLKYNDAMYLLLKVVHRIKHWLSEPNRGQLHRLTEWSKQRSASQTDWVKQTEVSFTDSFSC